jgi:hypothetical protein
LLEQEKAMNTIRDIIDNLQRKKADFGALVLAQQKVNEHEPSNTAGPYAVDVYTRKAAAVQRAIEALADAQ